MAKVSRVAAAAALTMLVAAGSPAAAQEVPVWQGAVFLTDVNSSCAAIGFAAGQFYSAVFRAGRRPAVGGQGGGFSFFSARDTYVYISTGGTELPGGRRTGTFDGSAITSRASTYDFQSNYNLMVSPKTIAAATTQVTVEGTISNFQGNTGCIVTLRGAFTLRP